MIICNFTPVPREDYRLGIPDPGHYVRVLSSDDARFGGSGFETPSRVAVENVPAHGFPQSIRLRLPPLAALVLAHERRG